jgi:hypothetical protein
MNIKLECDDDGVVVSTTLKIESLETEEDLQEVFLKFIKFIRKCGAKFPAELEQIEKDFYND